MPERRSGEGRGRKRLSGGGRDRLKGGKSGDYIVGASGGDDIWGNSGQDVLRGKKGDDHIRGGTGDDRLVGNAGADALEGGRGNDDCRGGAGRDRLSSCNEPETAPPWLQSLVRDATEHRAVGVDRVAVWLCDLPGLPVSSDPASLASAAQDRAGPYFAAVSRGKYAIEFVAAGTIAVSGDDDCLDTAIRRTGPPFTNSMGVRASFTNGQGTTGLIPCCLNDGRTVLDMAPNESLRGVIVDTTLGNLEHELGHSLHWPHSDRGGWNEPDVMGYGFTGHTLAFNRLANGWIDRDQVVVHRSGLSTVTLDAPARGGTQLVALPDTGDGWKAMTIEARPAIGLDGELLREGVAIHLIDQSTPQRTSYQRHQGPAIVDGPDAEYGYHHVLEVGETATTHGVTVEVTARTGDSFTVNVQGAYRAP